ncbi:MAG: PAS domain S-box protein [Calditrichaeota bacterium]|nr:MAG: PAS domain S-box protein [Calditrichota bacterium]
MDYNLMHDNVRVLNQEIETHLSILDSLAEGIIIADSNGQFLYFNSVAAKILGLGLQNIPVSEWSSVYGCFYPDNLTPFPSDQLPLARALRGEKVSDQVVFIKNPNRPEGAYINISANPIKNGDEFIRGGVVIFHDISETVRTEKLLKASKERITAQFKGFPIPTYVWQRTVDDFVLIDYNNAANIITKGWIKNHVGAKLSAMYTASPEIVDDFFKCYHEKNIVKREFVYHLRSTGEARDLIVSYVYIQPDLIMVHAEDCTERKKAESELKKLVNAVEQTADIVFITNQNGVIDYINPAFTQITGYERDEVMGRKPGMLRSGKHDHLFYKNMWNTLQNGEPFMDTIINMKKNGELFWCEQTITPIRDPQGEITHYVSVAKDVTQLKEKQEMELQLSIAQKIQQRISRATISLPGFDIAGKTHAAVHTSGDFYDFITMPDGCVGLVIADVCGKGIGPALIMAETRAFLRAFARLESDPAVILDRLNVELFADLEETQFVTLIFARLDPQNKMIQYASAGHGTAYLLNDRGEVDLEMESTGIPLGYIKDWKYVNGPSATLSSGSVVLFMTDGISEAMDTQENEFGDHHAVDIVRQNRSRSAAEIIECIYQGVIEFADENQPLDDITSVICKMIAE